MAMAVKTPDMYPLVLLLKWFQGDFYHTLLYRRCGDSCTVDQKSSARLMKVHTFRFTSLHFINTTHHQLVEFVCIESCNIRVG